LDEETRKDLGLLKARYRLSGSGIVRMLIVDRAREVRTNGNKNGKQDQ